jgi:hypothetical protein
MPIESGWPTVSQTLTVAHRRLLWMIDESVLALAAAGAAASSSAMAPSVVRKGLTQ